MSAQQTDLLVKAVADIIFDYAATDLLRYDDAVVVAEKVVERVCGQIGHTATRDLPGESIAVTYTNHREENMERIITPLKVYWGHTEWHPTDQWLMDVYDHDRSALRTYALKDCDFPSATW